MIQRMGRTARKRSGRVITLVSLLEEKKLRQSMATALAVQKSLTNTKQFKMFTKNPRMVRSHSISSLNSLSYSLCIHSICLSLFTCSIHIYLPLILPLSLSILSRHVLSLSVINYTYSHRLSFQLHYYC